MRLMYMALLASTLLTAGCMTRSISSSGYQSSYYGSERNALYQGELDELAVIGLDTASASDEAIGRALAAAAEPLTLRRGSSILLIQSGAMFPDAEMMQKMEQSFSVSIFSGVPHGTGESAAGYSRSLRLAAAKAGIGTILAYWGILETGVENLVTRTVSWVPVVGPMLPDQVQNMRIRMKIVAVDVRTGRWETFVPKPLDQRSFSAGLNRVQSDQAQVTALKSRAYALAADEILTRWSRR